jgi:2',3'-cyclic-nucleotide 2'-phosphodiesterase (5'-nucleotidase family)
MLHPIRFSLLLALIVAIAATAGESAAGCKKGHRGLTILSSASNRGEVKDCGCKKNPKGGLARRVELIDSLRAASDGLLLVDAGDYIHPLAEKGERLNWFILETMGEMGYDAMTLGELELYRGPDYVRSILEQTPVPVTLANVRFADASPIGERFIRREIDDLRCAIVGLVAGEFADREKTLGEIGFQVEDPVAVATELVAELATEVDLVVVLAHMPSEEARLLVESVPGIDVVVLGHYSGTGAATEIGNAVVVKPGQRGQYIGETRICLDSQNEVASYEGASVAVDVELIAENSEVANELAALETTAGD